MIDLRKCKGIDRKQLKIGTKIEMEHTNNPRIARRIASQHICEFPKYYPNLLRMEKGMRG